MEKKKRLTSAKRVREGGLSPSHDSRVLSNTYLSPVVEGVVKANLEFFSCLLLEAEEKSPHQVMVEMARRFSSFVPQGTMYPLLERLAREGKLLMRKGRGQEKLYSLAPDVADGFQMRKEHFLASIGGISDEILASATPQNKAEVQTNLTEFSVEKPGRFRNLK